MNTLEHNLHRKLVLLEEMRELSVDLIDRLDKVSEMTDDLVGDVELAMEQRNNIIIEIDLIDAQSDGLPQGNILQVATLKSGIRTILADLQTYQLKLTDKLQSFRQSSQEELERTRQLKRTLKGYYNRQIATMPSFVDNRG